jgi:small subunit ribosomal protein S7
MPRSGKIKKRILIPDPVYQDYLVARLINRAMKGGKKTVISKHVYRAFAMVKEKAKKEPLEIFHQAVENAKPSMEIRPRRVGGASYQVPMPVRGDRRESLAIRWLILAARARPSREYHTFAEKLAAEILDASQNTGGAVKRKEDVHRMAEANKAFAHFRW